MRGRCAPRVYVLGWHDLCVPIFRACGNHYVLAVVALLRGVQVSPFPPLALVPNETPAASPAGVSPCPRGIWFAGADAAGPTLLRFAGTAEKRRVRRGE